MSELDQIEKKIISDLESLNKDLDTIKRLKKKYLIEQNQLSIIPQSESIPINSSALGITETVKNLLKQFPDKKWTPNQFRDELTKLRLAGKLNSEAKDLRIAAHTVLTNLVKEGIVLKHNDTRIPTYTLK
jgi:hypothetical protein